MDRIQYVNQKRPYQSLETSKISVDDEEKDDNNEMNVEESDEKESGDEENDDDDDEKESGDDESNESGDNDDESNDDDKSNESNKSSESDYTPVKPKSHRRLNEKHDSAVEVKNKEIE